MSEDDQGIRTYCNLEKCTPEERHVLLAMAINKFEDEVIDILRSFGYTVMKKSMEIPY